MVMTKSSPTDGRERQATASPVRNEIIASGHQMAMGVGASACRTLWWGGNLPLKSAPWPGIKTNAPKVENVRGPFVKRWPE